MKSNESVEKLSLRRQERRDESNRPQQLLLQRWTAWAKNVVNRLAPRRVVVEARRIRDLSPPARRHYLKRLLFRPRSRSRLPRLDTGSPATILFVCHGNIMRSAIAAELCRAKLEGSSKRSVVVRSAGTNALNGSPADPRMCEAAAILGVSLASHRASPITESLVREADAVFVMDHLNEAELLARVPIARSKVYLLGAFVPSAEDGAEIQDPFMFEAAVARQCAQRIQACIDGLVEVLVRRA